ncbi:SUMF1/EgtB/PvdO family nonheme iron enzyme [uncultured Treponema sp.]|uniref:formylglycine-generating enzyme family protein n=1 Tax=uncultured Treponema sp. TaxID=162155 RepID=UPI0026396D70|nr:SUMF1/EgtB/PvdO family nonheme iron enzyme [uncultured Treponema sp.]
MKRQKLFAVLAAAALIFTSFGCKNDDGSDGSGDSTQPEYVGKIYSAKDGKTWLKIDSEEMATLAVWDDGTAAQSASRAAATTGSYILRQGKYTITIKDGNDIFSLKLEWTQNGKSYSYEIAADLTNGTTLANFKINGKSVDWEQTTAAPEKPSEDSSSSGGSSSGETGGESGGSSSEEEPDYSNVPVPEGFVRVPGVSIKGDETWTPESKVFVSGRKLKITSFFMSDHEVTRAEYKAVIGSDPSTAKAYDKDGKELTGDAAGNNPVGFVGWCNAVIYCNRRSVNEGLTPCYSLNGSTDPDTWPAVPEDADDSVNSTWTKVICDFTANGYRLPTEAEWEWAARGGENYIYAGSDVASEVAWCEDSTRDIGTREVKSKKANAYGIYDMSGNVSEWCWDMYADISSKTSSTGPSSDSYIIHRCERGGRWFNPAESVAISNRDYAGTYHVSRASGFRVARTIK